MQSPARNILTAGVLLLILTAAWLDQRQVPAPGRVPQSTDRPGPAQADPIRWFREDADGCLLPQQIESATDEIERGAGAQWRSGAATDQLEVDPCGNVWGLWFNSWVVYVGGDIGRRGHVQLPTANAEAGQIARSGVHAFLPRKGELWLLGNQSRLVRYREGGWRGIDAPQRCLRGDLVEHETAPWLLCRDAGASELYRWDEAGEAWQAKSIALPRIDVIRVDTHGRLFAAGAGWVARLDDWQEGRWHSVEAKFGDPVALSVRDTQAAVADENGISILDLEADSPRQHHPMRGVRNLAFGTQGLWVAAWRQGLHHFDGKAWTHWDYRGGLADDTARDLLISPQGALWLAGTPDASVAESHAAAALQSIQPAQAIAGDIYRDACQAARGEFRERGLSGQIAQEGIGTKHRVFFDDEQVCPDPFRADEEVSLQVRRRSDGALLQFSFNPHQSRVRCHADCGDSVRAAVLETWRLSLWLPENGVTHARLVEHSIPVPEPTPSDSPSAAVALPADGSVWLASRDSGIWRFKGSDWIHFGADHGFHSDNPVVDLEVDHLDRVWASTLPSRYAVEKEVTYPFHVFESESWRHFEPAVMRARNLAAGRIFRGPARVVAETNGGLLQLDPALADEALDRSLPGSISDLAIDSAGILWMAHSIWSTHRGLLLAQGARQAHLDSRDGLFEDRIRRVAFDDEGGIWLMAESGRVGVYARQDLFDRAGF